MSSPGGARSAGSAWSSVVDVLRFRARHEPDRRAYAYAADGDATPVWLTYGQLERRAAAWAAGLHARGARGERVLLLCPPGLDYVTAFFACLCAGAVPVPAYPPPRHEWQRSVQRLATVADDSGAEFVLATPDVLALVEARRAAPGRFERLRWLSTAEIGASEPGEGRLAPPAPDDVAFLQYTSGTTEDPKGVVVTHAALAHNLATIRECFQVGPDDVSVIWLPPYHDMGLIGGLLEALFAGFPALLLPPLRFVQRPLSWLRAIARERATVSGGPDFAYEMCVRRSTPEQRAGLDLSSWRVAFNGAETVRAETLERFREAFAPCGFRGEAFHPCYGLAEATLLVSGARGVRQGRFDGAALDQGRVVPSLAADARTLVSCGHRFGRDELLVVDPTRRVPCAVDRVGELWVRGPSVARGYRGRGGSDVFGARLDDSGAGPFLRTGDLGFLVEGELFVTGRLKELIVVRGRNHYPHDIERTVERSHPGLLAGDGAAFAVDAAEGEELVVVQAVERTRLGRLLLREVVASIVETLAREHGLRAAHVVLVRPGTIPRTTSGKIARGACRRRFLERTLEPLDPATSGGMHA